MPLLNKIITSRVVTKGEGEAAAPELTDSTDSMTGGSGDALGTSIVDDMMLSLDGGGGARARSRSGSGDSDDSDQGAPLAQGGV